MVEAGVVVGVGAGSILGFTVGHLLAAISGWIDAGAAWLLGQVGHALGASTSIQLGAGWFLRNYRTMTAVATATVLPFLLCAAIQAVVSQRAGLLARSALVHLPVALVLSAVAVQVVAMGLAVTDAMTSAISSGAGVPVTAAMHQLERATAALGGAGSQIPGFAVVLVAVFVAIGAVMLWLELLVREAAVYVAVLFPPLALAGLVWPPTAHWCRRLVDTLVAVVLSKFVIVAVLTLAIGAIGSAGAPGGFAAVLAGVALLILATCMPLVLLHLVPLAADGAMSGLEEVRHRAARAAVVVPRSAASFALGQAGAAGLAAVAPGSGVDVAMDVPGSGAAGAAAGPTGGAAAGTAGGRTWPGGGAPRSAGPGALGGQGAGGASGTGGDGGGGVPMWGGRRDVDLGITPGAPPEAAEAAPPEAAEAAPPEAAEAALPEAAGAALPEDMGSPVAVSEVPGAISGVPVPWREYSAGGSGDPEPPAARADSEHRFGEDDLGPVIRWVPHQGVDPEVAPEREPLPGEPPSGETAP